MFDISNMAGQQNESSDLILNSLDNNALYCDKSSDNNEYDVSSIKNYLKLAWTIGGPIQCVVSCRDQCAHKHTNMSLY